MIMRAALENIMPLWPQVAPLLERPLAVSVTHELEDVRRMIMSGHAHLWVQWTDHVEAAVVSEFISYPRGLFLNAWLAGSIDGEMDRLGFVEALREWARLNGCVRLRATGRAGWLKVVPGSLIEGLVMSTPVETLQ